MPRARQKLIVGCRPCFECLAWFTPFPTAHFRHDPIAIWLLWPILPLNHASSEVRLKGPFGATGTGVPIRLFSCGFNSSPFCPISAELPFIVEVLRGTHSGARWETPAARRRVGASARRRVEDRTSETATACGATALKGPRGRAVQMNCGARASKEPDRASGIRIRVGPVVVLFCGVFFWLFPCFSFVFCSSSFSTDCFVQFCWGRRKEGISLDPSNWWFGGFVVLWFGGQGGVPLQPEVQFRIQATNWREAEGRMVKVKIVVEDASQ